MGLGLEHRNNTSDECFQFGIISGCHSDCPVFERGDCDVQEENEKIFNKED